MKLNLGKLFLIIFAFQLVVGLNLYSKTIVKMPIEDLGIISSSSSGSFREFLLPVIKTIMKTSSDSRGRLKMLKSAMNLSMIKELQFSVQYCEKNFFQEKQLTCLGDLLANFDQENVFLSNQQIGTLVLGSCLQASTYENEADCYDQTLRQLLFHEIYHKISACHDLDDVLLRVFCFRQFI